MLHLADPLFPNCLGAMFPNCLGAMLPNCLGAMLSSCQTIDLRKVLKSDRSITVQDEYLRNRLSMIRNQLSMNRQC